MINRFFFILVLNLTFNILHAQIPITCNDTNCVSVMVSSYGNIINQQDEDGFADGLWVIRKGGLTPKTREKVTTNYKVRFSVTDDDAFFYSVFGHSHVITAEDRDTAHLNGQVLSIGFFENGYQNGTWYGFYSNGNVRGATRYSKDKKTGSSVYYYFNGNLKTIVYRDDNLGKIQEVIYFPNGNVYKRINYRNDKISGLYELYHENGILNKIAFVNENKINGYLLVYDELGFLISSDYYVENTKTSSSSINNNSNQFEALAIYSKEQIHVAIKQKELAEKNLELRDLSYMQKIDSLLLVELKNQTALQLNEIQISENKNRLLESEKTAEKEKNLILNKLRVLNEQKIADAEKSLILEKELASLIKEQKMTDSVIFIDQNNALHEKNELNAEVINKQKELIETEKRIKKIQFIFIITGSLLLIFAVSLLIFNIRSKRKIETQKKLIERQHEEAVKISARIAAQHEQLEQSHKEITDSINYAERLQRSLMSSKKLLDENLRNYFVYFNPKEAVSGDFYWSSELPDKKFALVCADSTGHGVPGAIMSMMNMNSLKEAVKEGCLASDEILNHTRSTIIETLANDGSTEGGKDGMDAALIIFNPDKSELEFSLANNPLWIIRGGELLEFKADKMPVGRHDKQDTLFTRHSEKLQKEDLIYSFTDGFADQFGGEKGKNSNTPP
jgi:serine phosphatase RsbU (regulator of sigma subunit)